MINYIQSVHFTGFEKALNGMNLQNFNSFIYFLFYFNFSAVILIQSFTRFIAYVLNPTCTKVRDGDDIKI